MPIAKLPFRLAALRLGAHWAVSDEELRPIVEATALVLPRTSLTERAIASSPYAAILGGLAAIVIPRLQKTNAMREEAASAPSRPNLATPRPRGVAEAPSGEPAQRPADPPPVGVVAGGPDPATIGSLLASGGIS